MMSNYPAGITFAVLLYLSSTFGTIFLITPFLPLLFIRPSLFRKIADVLVAFWKVYAVALYEVVFGVKVVFSGHPECSKEGALVLMNHRTRLDWMFYFSYELRYGTLRRGKIILKSLLKNIPGPGWAMQSAVFLFLHRRWEVDKRSLAKVLHYFQALKYNPQILLFPEGTDLTAKTRAKSNEFAEKENLPAYKHVLHPRTTGFVYLMKKMMEGKSFSNITDITIAYPENLCQNETDLLNGNFPREIHFKVNSYPISAIDTSEKGLTEWCQKLWLDKEKSLEDFYSNNRKFPELNNSSTNRGTENNNRPTRKIEPILYAALLFWTSFIVFVIVCLVYSSLVRWYTLLSTLLWFSIDYFCDGLDMYQTTFFPMTSLS